jgi:membrane-associated phospholipid phosphatase
LLVLGAILVGLSRIVLGVHFPIDVATGATLGTAIGLVSHRYFTKLREAPLPPAVGPGPRAEACPPTEEPGAHAEPDNGPKTGT